MARTLKGQTFRTDEGVRFKVLEGDYFSPGRIGKAHSRYLHSLRGGLLVSVSFRGYPVPVITVSSGVVRLVEVELNGTTHKGSAAISKLLGVSETRQPMGLFRG